MNWGNWTFFCDLEDISLIQEASSVPIKVVRESRVFNHQESGRGLRLTHTPRQRGMNTPTKVSNRNYRTLLEVKYPRLSNHLWELKKRWISFWLNLFYLTMTWMNENFHRYIYTVHTCVLCTFLYFLWLLLFFAFLFMYVFILLFIYVASHIL